MRLFSVLGDVDICYLSSIILEYFVEGLIDISRSYDFVLASVCCLFLETRIYKFSFFLHIYMRNLIYVYLSMVHVLYEMVF